jgi:hypothetical protein
MRIGCLALLALLSAPPVVAQETIVVAPTADFVEWLDDEPKVSGGERLVGLRLGMAAAPHFDPASVAVALPDQGGTICGRSVSRDGLYGSILSYGAVPGGAARAMLRPFSLRFDSFLVQYSADDLGVLVYAAQGQDCLTGGRLFLPLLGKVDRNNPRLYAFANSGNRTTTVVLTLAGDQVTGACREVDGLRVGFDRLCEIVLDELTGTTSADLTVEYDDLLAAERESYTILLSAGPAVTVKP